MRELDSLALDVVTDCQAAQGDRACSLFMGFACHLSILQASCRLQHWWSTQTTCLH